MQTVLNVTVGHMLEFSTLIPERVVTLSVVSFSYHIKRLCVSYPIEESCDKEEKPTNSLPNSLLSECGFALLLLGKEDYWCKQWLFC